MQTDISIKGSLSELENLHGKVTKAYGKGVDMLLNDMVECEKLQEEYKEEVKEVKKAGEDISEIPKPRKFMMSKDDMTLLKNAQDFLAKNEIQVEYTKKSGGRTLRNNLSKQLKDKLNQ